MLKRQKPTKINAAQKVAVVIVGVKGTFHKRFSRGIFRPIR